VLHNIPIKCVNLSQIFQDVEGVRENVTIWAHLLTGLYNIENVIRADEI
jgi:hypothetical protein